MGSILPLSLLGTGITASSFGVGYLGQSFWTPNTSIEVSIKNKLGLKLIKDQSQHKEALYKASFRHHKKEIMNSNLIENIYHVFNDSEGGKYLGAWCESTLSKNVSTSTEDNALKASQWCTIKHTIRNKLIQEGHTVIEEVDTPFALNIDRESWRNLYHDIYEKYKYDQEYKKYVLGGSEQLSGQAYGYNQNWCISSLDFYADSSETTFEYNKVKDWCVKMNADSSKKD